jgi:hypothetical protein
MTPFRGWSRRIGLPENAIGRKRTAQHLDFAVKYVVIATVTMSALIAVGQLFSALPGEQMAAASCGISVSTALARNCSFDLISFAWQLPQCYDSELAGEFSRYDWTFYNDHSGKFPIPQSIAIRGEYSFFVPWSYHVVQCAYMWRQMHRAYERGWIDDELRAHNHTLHCQNVVLDRTIPLRSTFTEVSVSFPACRKVNARHSSPVTSQGRI